MSRMVGADPDALDRLAADFDRSAGSFESTAARVGASVRANPWAGARATRFRNDWDLRHGPQLKRTAVALRAAAKQLRLQAQEQRRASSAGGMGPGGVVRPGSGPLGDRVLPSSPFGTWNDLQNTFKLEFGLYGLVGAVGALGKNANLVGRYPKGWENLIRRTEDLRLPKNLGPKAADFLKYKRGFNGIFSVNGLGEMVDNIPGLGKLGAVTGGIDLLVNTSSFATNPTPLGASQTVASALKTSKNPVAYLGGMALSSVNMAAEAATETDWSPEALRTTTDYIKSAGPGVVVEELGKATVEVFTKRIWSIF